MKELRGCGDPPEFFKYAENVAVRIRKRVKQLESNGFLDGKRGVIGDIVKLAWVIEIHAQRGANATGNEVVDLCERLEVLIDELLKKVDSLSVPI